MKLGDGSERVWKALVSHVQKSLHKNRILQEEKEINEKIVQKEHLELLTLKQAAWSDPSSSGISFRIAWISSGAHFCLIALTSLADIIQVMLFSVSGKASYLNVGSGLSGANPRNEPGTLSTTRWWYESLEKNRGSLFTFLRFDKIFFTKGRKFQNSDFAVFCLEIFKKIVKVCLHSAK